MVASLTICFSNAQPVPKLNFVSPDWIQRGKTTEVTFTGENISKISHFLFADEENFEAQITSPKPEVRLESSNGGIITGSAMDADKTLTARITVSAMRRATKSYELNHQPAFPIRFKFASVMFQKSAKPAGATP